MATESLAVLGALLLPPIVAMMGLLSLFLLRSLLYVVLVTLIFYHLTFVHLGDEEIGAAYWISVGASAIVVLAGTSYRSYTAEAVPQLSALPGGERVGLLDREYA